MICSPSPVYISVFIIRLIYLINFMLNYCFAQKWREEIFLSWTISSPGFDTLLCHITTAKLYMITINIQPLALYIISVSATSLHLCL